jgi:hypothetical protein
MLDRRSNSFRNEFAKQNDDREQKVLAGSFDIGANCSADVTEMADQSRHDDSRGITHR